MYIQHLLLEAEDDLELDDTTATSTDDTSTDTPEDATETTDDTSTDTTEDDTAATSDTTEDDTASDADLTSQNVDESIIKADNVRIARLYQNFLDCKELVVDLTDQLTSMKAIDKHYNFATALLIQCNQIQEYVTVLLDTDFDSTRYNDYLNPYSVVRTQLNVIDQIIKNYADAITDKNKK